MKHKTGRKLLSFLLTLAMVVGLVPGMSLTAYAATDTYTTLKNNVTVVQFNGYNWYIIEDNSTSATKGTVTLLAADNKFGPSKFSDSESSVYSSSKIKAALDAMTQEGGAFADVADAIVSTDLEDVSVTGAKLYLLSTGEAQNLNSTILNYNFPGSDKPNAGGAWWLRSPGTSNSDKYAACVFGSTAYTVGSVHAVGNKVSWNYGVRPALKLNLESVIFSSESNSFSLKPPHTHNFTYTASGDTITATCSADGCTLPPSSEGGNDHVATLTIAPSSTGGNTAELTGDKDEFDLTGVAITYQKKGSSGWENMNAAPEASEKGFFKASITLTGTDEKSATAKVTYGVSTVTKGTAANPDGKNYDFSVPNVSAVGAKITPTPTTELDTGYGIKKIIVKDENENDVSSAVHADKTGFIMPEYNVTVDVAFGMIDYTITKNDTTNGTFTVKKGENVVTTANYGDPVTLTAASDDGYALKDFMVKDSSDTMIELSGTGDTRTFYMPASNITVSAEFEGAPFNLTISDEITGGTVTAAGSGVETADNATTAKAGSTVTLTVKADTGFDFESLTVTKTADNSAVSVTKESDTVYKFTMPKGAVTVSATFAGHDTTATLSVIGNTGTTCAAKLLDANYKEIDSVTKKGGEPFILMVNRDEGYDFNVTYGTDSPVTLTEFTEDEYKAYVAYAKDNNISLSSNMVLAWVTMPGVADNSVTLTVEFSKLQTFTVLYRPSDSGTTAVWCKFAKTEGGNTVTASTQMRSDATMGDGSQVYSLKVTAAFAPTSVAFAATKDGVNAIADDAMTACETKTDTSDSDWTTITGSGKFCVIGGDAKTVVVAFVSDASNMVVYNSDTVEADEGTGTDGVTYRVAIVTDGSTGTVKAPANTLTKEGYDFAGWRGFEGTAPHKTEKIYKAGDSISVSENTTLNAVWNRKKSTVTLNLNGGTGNSSVDPVTYGEKLPTLENPTRSGFAFDGWKVSKAVTENGVAFAKGSPFDLETPITADLQLEAQWKHVHSYTCYRISTFGDALAAYAEYDSAIHVAICGCNDIQLMAHEFDSSGKCACGYQKPGAPDVTLNISYGQWSSETYTEKMKGMPETAKQGQEVSICAPDAWGDLQFSKWQYSTDNSTWYDLTADAYVSFLIPATMYVRALYVNPVTVPQVDLSARQYDDHTVVNGKTYTMDNILFQMNYKLPDGYTFVDAGIRLGDNAGISYYELKEITYTANAEAKALVKGFAALGVLVSTDPTNARFAREADSSETRTFYEVHKNSVLDEMTAAELAKHMYESKPINVEKYDPIYWEAKAKTKGMSGSMATLPPLRFAQKDNQDHWIYGIGWLRYKDKDGNIQTIYTEALATTVNGVLQNSTGTVTKVGN